MKKRYNIKRNDLCPCESGKKYKYCCEGKVDWNQIIEEGKDRTPYFSIRGRNLLFINKIAPDFDTYKAILDIYPLKPL